MKRSMLKDSAIALCPLGELPIMVSTRTGTRSSDDSQSLLERNALAVTRATEASLVGASLEKLCSRSRRFGASLSSR
jgi:hypothetical protein